MDIEEIIKKYEYVTKKELENLKEKYVIICENSEQELRELIGKAMVSDLCVILQEKECKHKMIIPIDEVRRIPIYKLRVIKEDGFDFCWAIKKEYIELLKQIEQVFFLP